jgi:cytochrome c-type biogenesis protein CcmH
MTVFWLAAVAMVVVALAFLVPPLVGRRAIRPTHRSGQNLAIARERLRDLRAEHRQGALSDAEFDKARRDLEDSLLVSLADDEEPADERNTSPYWPVAIAVAVPVLAGTLYLVLGAPGAFEAPDRRPGVAAGGTDAPSVESLLARLEDRLAANPDDEQGWRILARTYLSLQRFDEAVKAFERLMALAGDDPEVMVQYADALAMQAGGDLSGRPSGLVERALSINPSEPQGLWLGGLAAESRGQYQLAIERWRRLMPLLGDDEQARAQVAGLIDRARSRAADEGVAVDDRSLPAVPTSPSGDRATAPGEATVTVRVRIDPALADRVRPDQIVFIFARALDGPPMPLAVARRKVRDLPLEVELTDAMSMLPELRLSSFDTIQIGARVSASGQPAAASGDLEGLASPVRVASREPVLVTISKVLP